MGDAKREEKNEETSELQPTDVEEEETTEEKNVDTDEGTKEKKNLGMRDDEIVAVLGHELGHWALSHSIYNIVISEVSFLTYFGTVLRLPKHLYLRIVYFRPIFFSCWLFFRTSTVLEVFITHLDSTTQCQL